MLLCSFTLAKSLLMETCREKVNRENGWVPLPVAHFLNLFPYLAIATYLPVGAERGAEERREEDFCQLPRVKLSEEADRKSEVLLAPTAVVACPWSFSLGNSEMTQWIVGCLIGFRSMLWHNHSRTPCRSNLCSILVTCRLMHFNINSNKSYL